MTEPFSRCQSGTPAALRFRLRGYLRFGMVHAWKWKAINPGDADGSKGVPGTTVDAPVGKTFSDLAGIGMLLQSARRADLVRADLRPAVSWRKDSCGLQARPALFGLAPAAVSGTGK